MRINNPFNPMLASLVFFLNLGSGNAHAAQQFRVKDGDTITVKVSSRELTRISVEGEGRLDKVWGSSGVLEIQPDKDRGEIFIRPLPGAPAALSFFVRDDLGATYTIVAQQHDIPSETIILKSSAPRKSIGRGSEYNSTPYVDRIKKLMKGMALNEKLDGYSFGEYWDKVRLWKEAEIILRATYTGTDLLGEIYTIQNISDKPMVLHEREFLDFGTRVLAVSLERLSLGKDETTFLYVVRSSSGGD